MEPVSAANEGFRVFDEFVCRAIPTNRVGDDSNGDGAGWQVTVFHDVSPGDAHEAFQQWRRENAQGYFLNCRTSTGALLHRVFCHHHGDTQWSASEESGSLTKHTKVCSTDLDALRTWASQRGYIIEKCSHCLD